MANLRWFRKHQKIMLVVFGVGLMIVFVVTAAVPYWGNSGGGPSAEEIAKFNQPIVQWSGGTLTRSQLQRMLELHYSAMNFQEALIRDSVDRLPQGPMARPISAIPPETSMEDADRAIFARFMMAQFAHEKLGLVISDTAVYDYLQALTNSDVTQQYLAGIARSTSSQVGYNRLHEYLKMELAAMRLEDIIGESFFISGSGAAPANVLDAWQAFLQNEKQIECAVEEFNAAEFLPQIKDEPSTAELRKIYEEGKSLDVDPIGERPGFKQPRQVQVEYVTAEANAFMELAIQDVTPEQVLAEYNRLVEVKDPLVMEPIPAAEKDPSEKLEGEKLEDDLSEELKDNMGESKDPAPTPDAGKLDPPPSETPPTEKAPDADDGKQPSDPPKNSETEKDGAPAPSGSTDDKSGGVLLHSTNELQFVSLPVALQEPSQTPNPQEEQKQDAAESKPVEPAIPEKAQESEPSGDAAQDPSAQQPEMKQDPPPAAAAPDSLPPVSPPQVPTDRAKKLDATLELAIKQRLKREEANGRLSLAVEKAREAMNDYSLALSDYESMKNAPDGENIPPPKELDLKAYAAEHHLTYGKTELCTYEDLVKEPVGMATEFQQDPTTGRFGTKRAADDVFINFDRRRLFDVQEINSIGDRYLYWLIAKADSRIPSFESGRDDVISFWKKQKSIAMAKSAAEKVQGELQANGKRLVDEYKDKAKLTGAFRWFQPSFNQINYGAPKGVRNAGEAFMSVAFGLKPNEVGVALNDDRTAAYAIQLIAGDPRSDEQLRDQFLDHIATVRQIIPSATNTFYNRKSIDKLIQELNKDLKVEWVAY